MIQPEASYGRFRRLFAKRRRVSPTVQTPIEDDDDIVCPEDIIERDRVRRVQLAARGQQRILRELKKLETNPIRQYDHWPRGTVFFAIVLTLAFAVVELGHRMFTFESHPSDPLDVLRGVNCDVHGCSVRTHFDLEPPSFVRLALLVLVGVFAFIGCVRYLVGVHSTTLVTAGSAALTISLLYVSWRTNVYATARKPL